jgi:endonuclease/exonuclease/phosphatase (EEP) superfamily protein YafD
MVTASAVALLAATAATLGARLHWFLDLFSHFRWQYVIGAAATIPLAWLCGRRVLAIACVAALTLHLYALTHQRFAALDADRDGSRPLRIVSINVQYRNNHYATLIDYVKRLSPDVVCLYETTSEWQRQLAPLASLYAFSLFTGDGPHSGIACMSRIVPLSVVPPSVDSVVTPWMQLELESRGVRFRVIAAHLYYPISPTRAAARNREIAALARQLRALDGPVALVGDFNLTPYSPYNADLLSGSRLRDCGRGRPLAPTWPTWFAPLWIEIDRCFVTPDIRIASYQVGPAIGSDHYPVAVDLRISPGELWTQPSGQ